MKKVRRLLKTSIICGTIVLMFGCEEATKTADKVVADVEEKVQSELTKDNEILLSVKNGTLTNYPNLKIDDAFSEFFSSPTWKYFQAETGEHVVEFTGYCEYVGKEVKAKLQFLVEEGKESFEIGALEFNEVPQNELTKMALISTIYEGNVTQQETTTENITSNTEDSSNNLIEIVKYGYSYDFEGGDVIGDILSEERFENGNWYLNQNGEVVFNGDFIGEIFPEEASNLEFTFIEAADKTYGISSILYNGELVPAENHEIILELFNEV